MTPRNLHVRVTVDVWVDPASFPRDSGHIEVTMERENATIKEIEQIAAAAAERAESACSPKT